MNEGTWTNDLGGEDQVPATRARGRLRYHSRRTLGGSQRCACGTLFGLCVRCLDLRGRRIFCMCAHVASARGAGVACKSACAPDLSDLIGLPPNHKTLGVDAGVSQFFPPRGLALIGVWVGLSLQVSCLQLVQWHR